MDGSDVIDMRMSDHDLLQLKVMLCQMCQDRIRIVARVDDNGVVRGFVAQYGAVALQHSHRKGFDDHFYFFTRTASITESVPRVALGRSLKSGLAMDFSSSGSSR